MDAGVAAHTAPGPLIMTHSSDSMVVPQEAHGDPVIAPGPISEAPVAAQTVTPPVAPQTVVAQAVTAQTSVAAQTAQAAPPSPAPAPVGDVIATAPLPHTAQ